MENFTQSTIQKNVMRRVRVVHTMRLFLRAELGAFIVMVVALYGVGRDVWVARVFQNMPSLANVSASTHFWLAAFLDTRTIVQALIVVTIVAGLYFVREIARSLRVSGIFIPA